MGWWGYAKRKEFHFHISHYHTLKIQLVLLFIFKKLLRLQNLKDHTGPLTNSWQNFKIQIYVRAPRMLLLPNRRASIAHCGAPRRAGSRNSRRELRIVRRACPPHSRRAINSRHTAESQSQRNLKHFQNLISSSKLKIAIIFRQVRNRTQFQIFDLSQLSTFSIALKKMFEHHFT